MLFTNLLISCAGWWHTHTQTYIRAANAASHTHTETSDCVTYEKVIGSVGVEGEGGRTLVTHSGQKKINNKLKPTKSQRERFEVKSEWTRTKETAKFIHIYTHTCVRAWVSGCVRDKESRKKGKFNMPHFFYNSPVQLHLPTVKHAHTDTHSAVLQYYLNQCVLHFLVVVVLGALALERCVCKEANTRKKKEQHTITKQNLFTSLAMHSNLPRNLCNLFRHRFSTIFAI